MSNPPGIGERGQLARRLAASALLACASLVAEPAVAVDAAKSVTHTVVIDGVKYVPDALIVKRGDTVIWFNKDPFPHSVTAKGAFDSRDIPAGKSWKFTPRKAGDYAYTCTLHPNMTGMLKVE